MCVTWQESQLREVREHLRVQQEMVTGMRVREEALKTRLQDEVASYTDLQHRYIHHQCPSVELTV